MTNGEIFVNSTSNPTWPTRRTNCGENPETCEYMKGYDLGKKRVIVYDARCIKPIPETVTVELEGWGDRIPVAREDLSPTVICGFDNQRGGIKRARGAPSVKRK